MIKKYFPLIFVIVASALIISCYWCTERDIPNCKAKTHTLVYMKYNAPLDDNTFITEFDSSLCVMDTVPNVCEVMFMITNRGDRPWWPDGIGAIEYRQHVHGTCISFTRLRVKNYKVKLLNE